VSLSRRSKSFWPTIEVIESRRRHDRIIMSCQRDEFFNKKFWIQQRPFNIQNVLVKAIGSKDSLSFIDVAILNHVGNQEPRYIITCVRSFSTCVSPSIPKAEAKCNLYPGASYSLAHFTTTGGVFFIQEFL
jgi:hypothetical protein